MLPRGAARGPRRALLFSPPLRMPRGAKCGFRARLKRCLAGFRVSFCFSFWQRGAGKQAEQNEVHNENETKNTVEVGPWKNDIIILAPPPDAAAGPLGLLGPGALADVRVERGAGRVSVVARREAKVAVVGVGVVRVVGRRDGGVVV